MTTRLIDTTLTVPAGASASFDFQPPDSDDMGLTALHIGRASGATATAVGAEDDWMVTLSDFGTGEEIFSVGATALQALFSDGYHLPSPYRLDGAQRYEIKVENDGASDAGVALLIVGVGSEDLDDKPVEFLYDSVTLGAGAYDRRVVDVQIGNWRARRLVVTSDAPDSVFALEQDRTDIVQEANVSAWGHVLKSAPPPTPLALQSRAPLYWRVTAPSAATIHLLAPLIS